MLCGVPFPLFFDTVLNSDLWKQKIKTSQYWSLVYTTVYTIHAGAFETITIDGVYGSFTTNADGNCTHALPLGELTLTGSVSGQSFTRTVTSETTEVYVMPEGALYWYGGSAIETQYLSALSGGTRTKFDGSKSQTDTYWYRVAYMSTQKLNTSKYSNFHIIAKSSGTNASDTCAFVGTLGTISDLRYGSSVAISSSSLTEVEIPLNGYSVIDYVGFGMSQSSSSNRSIALTPNTNYVRYTDSLVASRIIDIYACWIE